MRYIQKLPTPDFFIEDTKELRERIKKEKNKSKVWDKDYKNKRYLKEYILNNEQNWICGYCEAKINLDNTHLEHIKPKLLDYDNLTFDYQNLIVSCQGTCFNELNDKTPKTCGHKKGGEYDETKFLNPTVEKDIRKYFKYTENGYIGASKLDKDKSVYTINLLQLNTFDNKLPEARKQALKEFRESIKRFAKKTGKTKKELAKKILSKENKAFISFLRYIYIKIL